MMFIAWKLFTLLSPFRYVKTPKSPLKMDSLLTEYRAVIKVPCQRTFFGERNQEQTANVYQPDAPKHLTGTHWPSVKHPLLISLTEESSLTRNLMTAVYSIGNESIFYDNFGVFLCLNGHSKVNNCQAVNIYIDIHAFDIWTNFIISKHFILRIPWTVQ